ncbi:MAG: hypothetical protein CMJ87_05975 [Planctomycetes bacterium]|nr:hypothetical protein [Planctomycetota bacterium]
MRAVALLLALAPAAAAQIPIKTPQLSLEATTPAGWRIDLLSTSEHLILRGTKRRHPVLRAFYMAAGPEQPTTAELFSLIARRIGGDERTLKPGQRRPLAEASKAPEGRTGFFIEAAADDGDLLARFVHVPNPDGSAHVFWLTAPKSPMRKAWPAALNFIHGSRFSPAPQSKPGPRGAPDKATPGPPPAIWLDAKSGLYLLSYPQGFARAPGTSADLDGAGLRLEPVDEDERDRAALTLRRKVVSPRVTARSHMQTLLATLDQDKAVTAFTYSPALVADRSAWQVDWTVGSGPTSIGHTLWLFQRERSLFSLEWVGDLQWKKEHSSLLRSFIKAIGLPAGD